MRARWNARRNSSTRRACASVGSVVAALDATWQRLELTYFRRVPWPSNMPIFGRFRYPYALPLPPFMPLSIDPQGFSPISHVIPQHEREQSARENGPRVESSINCAAREKTFVTDGGKACSRKARCAFFRCRREGGIIKSQRHIELRVLRTQPPTSGGRFERDIRTKHQRHPAAIDLAAAGP